MLTFIDSLLNRITMYRLVLYFLIILLAVAALFGFAGILPYDPLALGFSTGVLLLVCLVTNALFARVFHAQPNSESVYITALILALIINPVLPMDTWGISFLIWASVWAMASKYILALNKKHIFNPAAFAIALTAFTISQSATWWVGGNLPMLPFVAIGGLLVTRKIQRFDLVLSFFAVGLIATALTNTASDPLTTLQKALVHAPFFFFAFIMLTEPMTTPPTRPRRMAYGAFVGLLFAPSMHIGPIYTTPELALLVGNIFAWFLSPKAKYVFTLKQKQAVNNDIYDLAFASDKPVRFRPGQYMEWTLNGPVKNDLRGNRRYFTLASSPTEPDVRLGVKFYEPASSFKRNLISMEPGSTIIGGQLAGDFTLPSDPRRKLVFIAGGIGITPFRSMVKYLMDRGEARDTILFYSTRTIEEIAYRDVFEEAAQKIGLRTIYAITDVEAANAVLSGAAPPDTHLGRIDANLIEATLPDYRERAFYISGTHTMVTAFKKTLGEMHIPKRNIKTDFFPGFA